MTDYEISTIIIKYMWLDKHNKIVEHVFNETKEMDSLEYIARLLILWLEIDLPTNK